MGKIQLESKQEKLPMDSKWGGNKNDSGVLAFYMLVETLSYWLFTVYGAERSHDSFFS
jgi:hypothetical protein